MTWQQPGMQGTLYTEGKKVHICKKQVGEKVEFVMCTIFAMCMSCK